MNDNLTYNYVQEVLSRSKEKYIVFIFALLLFNLIFETMLLFYFKVAVPDNNIPDELCNDITVTYGIRSFFRGIIYKHLK